ELAKDHPLELVAGFRIDANFQSHDNNPDKSLINTPEDELYINTPDGLAQAVCKHTNTSLDNGEDQGPAYSLLTPCVAYGQGTLMQRYLNALEELLDTERSVTEKQAMGSSPLRQLCAWLPMKADLQKFDFNLNKQTVDLKHQFTSPLTHLLTELALIYGFKEYQPRAILGALVRDSRFQANFAIEYRQSLAFVHGLRIKWNLKQKRQQDKVPWQALSAEEQAILRGIQQRLLRPLHAAMTKWLEFNNQEDPKIDAITSLTLRVMLLREFDPALMEFTPPDAVFSSNSKNVSYDQAISLAATLAYREEDATICEHYYRQVIKNASSNDYTTFWRIWQEQFSHTQKGQVILSKLCQIPAADGWRPGWHETRNKFYAQLKTWFTDPSSANDDKNKIIVQTSDFDNPENAQPRTYCLKPEIQAQFFDANGYLRPEANISYEGQTFTIFCKANPENPLLETLVSHLAWRLFGGGTPLSVLMKLSTHLRLDQEVTTCAMTVQALPLIKAEPLNEVLNPQINMAPFTRALLLALLVSPEDDGGENYL
ncbi:MAG: putative nucleotidyltransferase substrate binding domain-containing protein, partial [Gammaproteobacteria bacterium]